MTTESFMSVKRHYDSLNQAIKLAKAHGAKDADLKPLVMDKQDAKQLFNEAVSKILRGMTLAKNIVHIQDNWYGVRYLNAKDDPALMIEILMKKDLYLLERDCRRQRELQRKDIDAFVPGMVDEVGLEAYKQEILENARGIVEEQLGIKIDMPEGQSMRVSSHTGKRWVQRKYGIRDDTRATEYYKSNKSNIDVEILVGYESAQLVWTDEEGIQYMFDADNMMYVVSADNKTIITLYEEDFGFSSQINRSIVLQQAEQIREAFEKMKKAEEELHCFEMVKSAEIKDISGRLQVLEAEIEALVAKKQSILALREERSKAARVLREQYNAQCDKLFKKWDN